MSTKEHARLEIIQRIRRQGLGPERCQRNLGICKRNEAVAQSISTAKRQWAHHQASRKVLDLLNRPYQDFVPAIAHEKLTEKHD